MAFSIQPSPEIWSRLDLPILANWRKLWRIVEIGVDRADFAHHFLSRWQGSHYYGVDSYEPFPEANWDREADYLMAVARLEQFGNRARLIRADSYSASLAFSPCSVDLVYVDGAHDYESVQADLRAWFPALSDHGIIAGHDWTDQAAHYGVKPAVTEFARDLGQTIYLTSVEGYGQESEPSWMIYKSGMPGPDWRRC